MMVIKKTTEKVQKYKTVKNGFQTVTMWEASDGEKFVSKRAAEFHETVIAQESLLKKAESLLSVNAPEIPEFLSKWYYAATEEDLETIKQFFHVGDRGVIYPDVEFKVGEWYAYDVDYGGDGYRDIVTILSLSLVKERINEFFRVIYNCIGEEK